MSWIAKVQNKPKEHKVRIIWISCISMAIILLVLWVFTSNIPKKNQKDTTLFQAIGRSLHDTAQTLHPSNK